MTQELEVFGKDSKHGHCVVVLGTMRKVRESLGLTQEQLAAELEVSDRTIRNYECDGVKVPRWLVLALWALFAKSSADEDSPLLN